jgi:hypothetical protein
MNNLYHKVVVSSVCTALSFALGANEEAYSATFTLQPTLTFEVVDLGSPNSSSLDWRGDAYYYTNYPSVHSRTNLDRRASYEFNISHLSLANALIRHAIVETRIDSVINRFPIFVAIFGYVGNGRPDISDFEAGVHLNSVNNSLSTSAGNILSFDVTPFVNQLVRNNDTLAGFTISASSYISFGGGSGVSLNATDNNSRLVIETIDAVEPVPEPTTIFGSALALSLGGWLKRKKSSQNNQTAPQS